jgi:hypothetical protein
MLLLTIGLSANAEFRTITRAYEIALSDLRVPGTASGSLIFKKCADCDSQVILMSSRTQFIVNGESVGIKEFRKNVFRVRDRRREVIIVKHHLESDTITSLRVTL